ncbi:MAG: SsrA-binding protein SmpB [Spirochaetia bacterium]|nr:SsrA-binding protein SmpB [Spirochaetia bacterium]MBR4437315.1 SsrA-binding protein SmpB [Spirochaetales bacterium]MBR4797091.1 SsrA-binding protein SmpB [Spirochaetia bacterium]MBR5016246.1 SsrA-binding protein SmpB [Spirochaetia bacterium]MBR5016291.1 SsrA-binding protein SmpB [Spirochaetia bacterium]
MGNDTSVKLLLLNKKARFNFFIDETLECGIELQGTEVKSLRENRFSFGDSYARIKDGQLYLVGFHISPYPFGNLHNHEPDRDRKLLVHKEEIRKLRKKVEEKGFTLVPIKVYLKNGLIKVELGICRGKKLYDKRETIKQRDLEREA